VEILREAAPEVTRVALVFNPNLRTPIVASYLGSIEAAARTLAVQAINMPVRDSIEAVHAIEAFAPQLLGEPVVKNGRLKLSALDKPGFGVELNREIKLHRPYPR
jgi:hypothetical protein